MSLHQEDPRSQTRDLGYPSFLSFTFLTPSASAPRPNRLLVLGLRRSGVVLLLLLRRR
jgi:hypothetical protein